MSDWQLLRQYVDEGSDAAFTQLVDQHKKLVYWTCRRDIGDVQLAEDAAQAVFITLARKAATIRKDASLAGWLFTVARHVSKRVRDAEQRRRRNEERAALHMQTEVNTDAAWEQVEPWLNDALASLSGQDRGVVLLRFCEGYSFPEIAGTLGTTEEAARKRVARSLERLRSYLGRKNVSVATTVLAAFLAERAANAVPDTCTIMGGKAILAAASAGAAHIAGAHTGSLLIKKGATIIMDATIKKAAIAGGIILLLGGGIAVTAVKHHAQASRAASASSAQGTASTAGAQEMASDPSVQWAAAHASDPATRTAEQQVQGQLGRWVHGWNSQSNSEALALISPNCVVVSPNGTTGNYYQDVSRAAKRPQTGMVKGSIIFSAKINSCRIDGNTAIVVFDFSTHVINPPLNGPIRKGDYVSTRTMTFTNTGGQWLITSYSIMPKKAGGG